MAGTTGRSAYGAASLLKEINHADVAAVLEILAASQRALNLTTDADKSESLAKTIRAN
jgi:hypothetical protein